MSKIINITGERYGRLTVIRCVGYNKEKKAYMWECRCDCGNVIQTKSAYLRNNSTKSCGCLADEIRKRGKHYASDTRLYSIWEGMKTRCYNPNCKSYKDYGERGIRVCSEWKTDFDAFCRWALVNGYSDDLTIDRINPNGMYEPSNCRWITKGEQSRNRNYGRFIVIGEERKILFDWCREYNIKPSTVINRIKMGWSESDAVTKPVRKTKDFSKWVRKTTQS